MTSVYGKAPDGATVTMAGPFAQPGGAADVPVADSALLLLGGLGVLSLLARRNVRRLGTGNGSR
jgi:hypothetical protein